MNDPNSGRPANDPDYGSSVLIVEDNPEFVFHLSQAVSILERGWTIEVARTAQQALALSERSDRRFRLALVDIGLPDRSGIDVVQALTARDPDLPVLVVSILSTEETVLSAIRAGARGYLLKDDSATIIRDAIEQVLNNQYPISPALARFLFRMVKSAPGSQNLPHLTARELDVLTGLADGMTYTEIAEALDLSLSTIRTHIQKIYRKLDAKTGSEAVAVAKTNQLI